MLAGTQITIDPDTRHQTMQGWEISGRFGQYDKISNTFSEAWRPYSSDLTDRLVNELGINRVRLQAKSGMENSVDYWTLFENYQISYEEFKSRFYEKINDNDDPLTLNPNGIHFSELDFVIENMVLPIREKLEARGEQLYFNLNYIDFKWTEHRGDIEHSDSPAEYAEFILACFEHLKSKYNIIPDALEIILEPDNTLNWTGENIGSAMVQVIQRLNEAGFSPDVIAPSTAVAARAMTYFNPMIAVPGVADLINTFSYHRYGSPQTADIQAISDAAARWNLDTAMLEHTAADVHALFQDLTTGNISAWQQWGVSTFELTGQGGYHYKIDPSLPSGKNVYLDKLSVPLSQIFSRVRMGAQRLDINYSSSTMTPVAFVNRDQTYVLSINSTQSTEVDIAGLPAGTYGVTHATYDGKLSNLDQRVFSGETQTLSTEQGLTTLYQISAEAEEEPGIDNTPTASEPQNTGGEQGMAGEGTSPEEQSGSGAMTLLPAIALLLISVLRLNLTCRRWSSLLIRRRIFRN